MKKQLALAACMALLMAAVFHVPSLASDVDKGSVTVRYYEEQHPKPGVSFFMHRIGTQGEDGAVTWAKELDGISTDLSEAAGQDGFSEKALEAASGNAPDYTAVTDEGGSAVFGQPAAGVYAITSTETQVLFTVVDGAGHADPDVLEAKAAPNPSHGGEDDPSGPDDGSVAGPDGQMTKDPSNGQASGTKTGGQSQMQKTDIVPDKVEKLPQTGLMRLPVLILGALSILCAVSGVWLYKRGKC